MNERKSGEIPEDLKAAEDIARNIARALDRTVHIGHDLSITVGKVTFGWEHVRDAATLLDLADLIDYYDEIGTGTEHFTVASTGTIEPGWKGWREQSTGPTELPQEFITTVEPPKTIRQLARKALLGR